jgi:hypothetical protein
VTLASIHCFILIQLLQLNPIHDRSQTEVQLIMIVVQHKILSVSAWMRIGRNEKRENKIMTDVFSFSLFYICIVLSELVK